MSDLTKSSCVQAVEGSTHELASSFRHLFTSTRYRVARRSLGASSNLCRPATSSNGCGVTFHDSLSREPASCNRSAETSAARPWAVLVSAVLCCGPSYPWKWNTQRTYRTEMENVSPLTSQSGVSAQSQPEGSWWTPVEMDGLINRCFQDAVRLRTVNSEDCSFLFLSHFMSDNSHMRRLGLLYFSLGGFLCFCSFCSLLIQFTSNHAQPTESQ